MQSEAAKPISSSAASRAAARSGAPEMPHELHREYIDGRPAVCLARIDNLRQRRMAERLQPQKPGTE